MTIKIKQALKEIFTDACEEGGLLHGYCDVILRSIVQKLPNDVSNFITLGNYQVTDVQTGDLIDKYRLYEIEIGCGACIIPSEENAEANAEERSDRMAKIIRTILKSNRKLISESYPDGAAISSSALGDYLEFVIYENNICSMNKIRLTAKIIEDNAEYFS